MRSIATQINMKQIFLINVHSFVDVITNSSTELFICDTKKSVEVIKTILQKIIDITNLSENGEDLPQSSKVEDIFNVYELTDKNAGSLTETLEGYCTYTKYEKKQLIGKIVIERTSDNIIPYEIFDLITQTFNTDRIHLG